MPKETIFYKICLKENPPKTTLCQLTANQGGWVGDQKSGISVCFFSQVWSHSVVPQPTVQRVSFCAVKSISLRERERNCTVNYFSGTLPGVPPVRFSKPLPMRYGWTKCWSGYVSLISPGQEHLIPHREQGHSGGSTALGKSKETCTLVCSSHYF